MPLEETTDSAPAPGPRVLIWPSCWYPNQSSATSGIFIRRQAAAIAAFCPTAVLFVSADPSLKSRREIGAAVEEGLPTVRARFRPAGRFPGRIPLNTLRFLAAAVAGRRALPPPFRRPDLVHVQVTPPAGLILFLRLFWRRVPLVFSEHWSKYLLPPGRENPLRRLLMGGFIGRCAAVTAVSEVLSRGMRAHGWRAPRWRIIGNPVDPAVFHPRSEAPAAGAWRTILHVSSLAAVKNAPGIVRAAAGLIRRRPGVRLLLVGEGPARGECEDAAREQGLLGREIRFLDPLPEGELAALMRRSDILVLFSSGETFACVAAEALASGLAVVSTPTAVGEYLPAGSGELVPFGDERALAAALERTLDRLPGFDPGPGRRAVGERFAPPEIGRKFLGLFREVLGGDKP